MADEEDTAVTEAPVRRDPLKEIGIGADGDFSYVDFPQPYGPERIVSYAGSAYEHCADDREGVWLYRQVR